MQRIFEASENDVLNSFFKCFFYKNLVFFYIIYFLLNFSFCLFTFQRKIFFFGWDKSKLLYYCNSKMLWKKKETKTFLFESLWYSNIKLMEFHNSLIRFLLENKTNLVTNASSFFHFSAILTPCKWYFKHGWW